MNKNCFAQNNMFVREYGGFAASWLNVTSSGYLLQYGNLLVKTDWVGNIIWSKQFATSYGGLSIQNIKKLPGGKYVFTGSTGEIGIFYFVKIDSIGNEIFSKKFISHSLESTAVETLTSGEFIVTARAGWPSTSAMIIKLDALGNILWFRSLYSNTGNLSPGLFYIKECPNKDLIMVGDVSIVGNGPFLVVAKLDSSASVFRWGNMYSQGDIPGECGIVMKGNDVIISNPYLFISNQNSLIRYPQLTKIDSGGNVLQHKVYSGDDDHWSSIYSTSDNGFITAGYGIINFVYQGVFVKLDSTFTIQYAKRQGIVSPNYPGCGDFLAEETPDLGFISLGSNGSGSRIFKTDSLGNAGCMDSTINYTSSSNNYLGYPLTFAWDTITVSNVPTTISVSNYSGITETVNCYTGINDQETNTEIQIYPNPSSDKITIHFEKFTNEKTNAVLYNVFGQQILAQQISSAQSEMDIHQLASGIYFLQIKMGVKVFSKKIVKE